MTDLRIVVAGHVDHGKSTLIGRLLYENGSLPQQVTDNLGAVGSHHGEAAFAFVMDQLSEEQEGGFTLDTTQAHFHTAERDYTLIDTPGHKEFLKNMVTGTTRADAAILVIDAAEGPLPQTYLHAYLIAMLGIHEVIVAVNKMDLICYDRDRFETLSRQLLAHLKRIGIVPVAVVPISAQQGDHIARPSDRMPWNRTPPFVQVLNRLAAPAPEEEDLQPLRFLVQSPFSLNGNRVILGKVASGTLRQGHPLVFGPPRHETTVVSVLAGEQSIPLARAGACVGLLLEDPAPIGRGHVGFDGANVPEIADRFRAKVFWIHPMPLGVRDRIEILCGTQCNCGHVESICGVADPVSLKVGGRDTISITDSHVAEVIIRMDSPICVDPFDVVPELGRFAIVRDKRIAGGGIIA